MREELLLRFLDFADTRHYTLEQSHGVPPFLAALGNTTLEDEPSCGYFFPKTVRSIDLKEGLKTSNVENSDPFDLNDAARKYKKDVVIHLQF